MLTEQKYLIPDEQDIKIHVRHLIENRFRGMNVEVLNGNRVPGIAHKVANKMNELGFNVVNIDNADHFDYQKTVLIVYSKNDRLEEYIKQYLNDIEIIRKIQPNNGIDMTIIIGKNMIY